MFYSVTITQYDTSYEVDRRVETEFRESLVLTALRLSATQVAIRVPVWKIPRIGTISLMSKTSHDLKTLTLFGIECCRLSKGI